MSGKTLFLSVLFHALIIVSLVWFYFKPGEKEVVVPVNIVFSGTYSKNLDYNPSSKLFNISKNSNSNLPKENLLKPIAGKKSSTKNLPKIGKTDINVETPPVLPDKNLKTYNPSADDIKLGNSRIINDKKKLLNELNFLNDRNGETEVLSDEPTYTPDNQTQTEASSEVYQTVDLDSSVTPAESGKTFNYDKFAYLKNVRDKITGNWKLIKKSGDDYEILVRIFLDKSGNLVSYEVVSEKGDQSVKNSALTAINTSKPFGSLPDSFPVAEKFSFIVRFSSDNS